jgi:hypothetical protein
MLKNILLDDSGSQRTFFLPAAWRCSMSWANLLCIFMKLTETQHIHGSLLLENTKAEYPLNSSAHSKYGGTILDRDSFVHSHRTSQVSAQQFSYRRSRYSTETPAPSENDWLHWSSGNLFNL